MTAGAALVRQHRPPARPHSAARPEASATGPHSARLGQPFGGAAPAADGDRGREVPKPQVGTCADGITAHAVNPGGVATGLRRNFTTQQKASLDAAEAAGVFTCKTVEQGAATSIVAAVAPEFAHSGGHYLLVARNGTPRHGRLAQPRHRAHAPSRLDQHRCRSRSLPVTPPHHATVTLRPTHSLRTHRPRSSGQPGQHGDPSPGGTYRCAECAPRTTPRPADGIRIAPGQRASTALVNSQFN